MNAAVEILGNKLSNKQKSLLNLATKVAATSELAQRHGAVIVKNGRVLALGVNKQKNADINTPYAVNAPEYFTVHAEADAINRARNIKGATIYIARVNKNGEERFSRPCDSCAEAIRKAGIRTVIYTLTEGNENDD